MSNSEQDKIIIEIAKSTEKQGLSIEFKDVIPTFDSIVESIEDPYISIKCSYKSYELPINIKVHNNWVSINVFDKDNLIKESYLLKASELDTEFSKKLDHLFQQEIKPYKEEEYKQAEADRIKYENKPKKKAFHEEITERIIKQLEVGTAPWQKPWNSPQSTLPINPTTGQEYKGINRIQLMSQGYIDHRWLTYKQAKSINAQIRKGEHGTQVQYWQFSEKVDKLDGNGKPMFDDKGKKIQEEKPLDKPKVYFATVFNAQQIDNMPPLQIKPISEIQNWENQERVENIIKNSGAVINYRLLNRAFYSPASDSITLPNKSRFPTASGHYATVLHELGHWTGHKSRLNRDLSGKFGSEKYAKEELRAEIASMIIGEKLQTGHDPKQHANYVKSWIKVLRDDPFEILRAASDAEKIHNYVMKFEQKIQIKEKVKQEVKEDSPKSKRAKKIDKPDISEPKKQVKKTSVEQFQVKAEKVKQQKQHKKQSISH